MDFQNTFVGLRVLVTGDTGFKGSWLCEWLYLLGADVVGIGLAPNTQPALFEQLKLRSRINHQKIDIRDVSSVQRLISAVKPDIILHLAAQPLVRLSYEIPVETYATNVMGTVHILDAVRQLDKKCAIVCVTTDKCYENREWLHSYCEKDPMGGHDPYSSSKGACEIAIQSIRKSYFYDPEACGIALASARAGNVIGGGDWAQDRIIPDCIRSLKKGMVIPIRNKSATRPWQHVLEPLSGYLLLAAELWRGLNKKAPIQAKFHYTKLCSAFNFGPNLEANRTVDALVEEVLKHWPGKWLDHSDPDAPYEASLLNLSTDKAFHMLNWTPRWNFEDAIANTIKWYRAAENTLSNLHQITQEQVISYQAKR
jgi:CDP-glucose 4,6-dehydratase